MKLLLDTNVLYWWMTGEAIGSAVVPDISDSTNHVSVSTASIWELSIKVSIGKLILDVDVEETLSAAQIEVLDVDVRSALAVRDMPLHHRDPLDRLIIAQAQLGGYTILTRDKVFADYDVDVIMV